MSHAVQNTNLSNVEVTAADTIEVNFNTPIASPDSFVGVWSGLSIPYQHLTEPLARISTSNQSSGTVEIHDKTQNFREGTFVVGYCVGSDKWSVSATTSMNNGQTIQYQSTSMFLVNQSLSSVQVYYDTPVGNIPNTNLDWILLYPGQAIEPGNAPGEILHYAIPTNSNTSQVGISFPAGTLEVGRQYTLEYNPGHTIPAVSASYTFEFNA